jgi:3-oxoacyl-[acyl-carrier-protein] synthase III
MIVERDSEIGIAYLDFYLPETCYSVLEYSRRAEYLEKRSPEEIEKIWTDTGVEPEVLFSYFQSETNDDYGNFDFPARDEVERFVADTGIDRIYCASGEDASDMSVKVARQIMSREPNLAKQIDMLTCYQSTINQAPAWSTVCRLQYELGLGKIPTFTVSQKAGNCSLVALKIAWEALRSEPEMESVLLIGGEKLVPPYRRAFGKLTAMGDSASAMLVRRNARRFRPVCFNIRDYPDSWNPNQYSPSTISTLVEFLADESVSLMDETLAALKLGWKDVACIIPPSFSRVLLHGLEARLPNQNIYSRNLSRFGHLPSSDPVIALSTIAEEEMVQEGDLVLLLNLGLGLSLGVVALLV